MMYIDAKELDYATINGKLRNTKSELEILNCCGQKFIVSIGTFSRMRDV